MACFPIREPSIEALKNAPIYFRYGSSKKRVLVDGITAQAVLAVYGACETEQQAKLERMVAGSFAQFARVAEFSMKRCRVGA